MTTHYANIAAADQAAAHLRDSRRRSPAERVGQIVGAVIVVLGALLGLYAYAAAAGHVPAAPWSPVGQVVEDDRDEDPPPAPVSPEVGPEPVDGGVDA